MRNLLLLFFLSFSICATAQNNEKELRISDSVRISLVTGSPGSDLYAQFGHSAIRVVDYKFRNDMLFNYGTFDFNTPNFYWKFLRGKLNYKLDIDPTIPLARYYEKSNRTLIEQEFLLDKAEKQAVVNFLMENYRPENRFYLYDFFYDNCATRIRDIFEEEVTNFSYENAEVEIYTFRQMLDLYTGKWVNFGMDLILGYPTDEVADMRNQMFLPDFLAENLTKFAKNDENPLLGEPRPLNKSTGQVKKSSSFFTPLVAMILLFLMAILFTFFAAEKGKKWFDRMLFSLLGIMGIFMLFLWFGTDHWTTTKNLNVLWANPLFLLLLFLKRSRTIYLIGLIGAAMVLLGWSLLPQQFHLAFIPILLAIVIRCLDNLGWLPTR